jgi:hypothetical protein
MANELVFDVTERVGALAADVIDLVEEAGLDPQTSVGVGAFNGPQRRFRAIEHDTAQGAFDVAEQAVLNRVPLGGIGWVVGNAQGCNPPSAPTAFTANP